MAEDQESMTRSEKLALVDVAELLPQCLKKKTVTKKDFTNHMSDGQIHKPKKIVKYQADAALVSGHYANNLKVNAFEEKTRTWPYAMDWREEYKQFLMRTKWCNENIYKLFFENPPVRYDQVEDFLKDLRKTVYTSSYSPNEYVSLNSQKKVKAELDDASASGKASKDIQTTYGNYYNRLQELQEQHGAELYRRSSPINMTKENFAKNMRKLFRKYDLSTYYETICVPALVTAKDGKMPTGPIDRYTLRKY